MTEVERNIDIPGTDKRIYGLLRDVPDAPIVVLSHCITAGKNVTEYYNAARAFEAAGFASYRFDYYGWPDDARKILECTIDTHASDLDLVIDSLKDEWPDRPIAAVGHSMGGLVILASHKRRYDAIGLWDATHSDCWEGREIEDAHTVWEPSLGLFRFKSGVDELVTREYVESYRLRECDPLAELITVPLLSVMAGQTPEYMKQARRRYHELSKGPKHLVEIEEANHQFNAGECQTTLFDETISWLQQTFENNVHERGNVKR